MLFGYWKALKDVFTSYKSAINLLQVRLESEQQPLYAKTMTKTEYLQSLVDHLHILVGLVVTDVFAAMNITIPANIKEELDLAKYCTMSAGHSPPYTAVTEDESLAPSPSAVSLAKSLTLGIVEAAQSPTKESVVAAQSPKPGIVRQLKAPK